jgi:sulfite reductase alpha subunit-like flavoprotein
VPAQVAEGSLTELRCAFSRDAKDEAGNKVYVQSRIRSSAESVWRMLSQHNATIYVAGNAKNMPAAVRRALVDVVVQQGGKDGAMMNKHDAEAYVRLLEKKGRYQTETWA